MPVRWPLLLLLLPLSALPAQPPANFEDSALAEGQALLKSQPTLEQLANLETKLVQTLRQHYAERDRPLVGANPWTEVETRLQETLRDMRSAQLPLLLEQADTADKISTVLKRADEW